MALSRRSASRRPKLTLRQAVRCHTMRQHCADPPDAAAAWRCRAALTAGDRAADALPIGGFLSATRLIETRRSGSIMDTAKVAIIGFGTIGSGVARLLLEHGDRIARQAGKRLELVHVVDPDLKRPRNFALPPGVLTADLAEVTDNPEIVAAVELVGGLEPARTIVLKLLESGKDVITANKALLAEHGPELFDTARKLGRSIAFEAAVAGGIPIIAAISECLTANQIESIHAILNGTSNFILTQMEENDTDYAVGLGRGPAARLCRGQSGHGRQRQRRRPEAGHPGPPGLRRPGQLAQHPAHGHRHGRRGRHALRQGTGLQHQAAGRGRAGARGAGTARFAHAGAARHAAGRGPRGLQRRSAWWATPWAGCSSTAWAPARCPPPRPSWPT